MLLDKIQKAVWEVQSQVPQYNNEGIIICYSQLLKPYVLADIRGMWNDDKSFTGATTTLVGCAVNEYWPYNEIVVYHKEGACKNPKLISKIDINV